MYTYKLQWLYTNEPEEVKGKTIVDALAQVSQTFRALPARYKEAGTDIIVREIVNTDGSVVGHWSRVAGEACPAFGW